MLVGKDYKIETDELNVTVSKRSVARKGANAGQETWTNEGYFMTLENALKYLVDREVKETYLTDLKTVIAKQHEIKNLITQLKEKGWKSPEEVDRICEDLIYRLTKGDMSRAST